MESYLYFGMEEPEIQVENLSLRTKLIRTVLEHFVILKEFEMLDVTVLEPELRELLKACLTFETRVELNNDPNMIDKGILSGRVLFLEPLEDGQLPEGFKVVDFNVMPTVV